MKSMASHEFLGKQQLPSNFRTSYSISALLRISTKLLQLHKYCD